MQLINGRLVYSATDLVAFTECRHLANLERAAASGHLRRPTQRDPVLDRIAEHGLRHEQRFLDDLVNAGADVAQIQQDREQPSPERLEAARAATLDAMRRGVDVVYQAVLFDGRKLGYADFLRRVDEPSDLGGWSYEVWDTKLARSPKASAVVQLCLYSDLLAQMQGRPPARMHLALGGAEGETASFRVSDFAAYYRSLARQFEAMLDSQAAVFPVTTSPEPVEHCGVCRWAGECRARWRREDDLSLVAGLSSRQRRALHRENITTRTSLAEPQHELPDRLDGAGREALARIRAQASIQVRGEREGSIISERLDIARDREGAFVSAGLLMLPEPSPGDLFFDIEGDPFFVSDEADGIDYLFGVIEPGRPQEDGSPTFHAFWAIEHGTVTPAAERRAFEVFIDLVMDRWARDPNMHVYHYAPYEPTAVKRLAGRYGTREREVDRLLRGNVFVDLYRAVRQGIRASVESYSIKRLEPLYGFVREIDLRDAGDSIVEFETWLELGEGYQRDELLEQVERYNRDDCVSTWRLRDWLEAQRAALATDVGELLARPGIPSVDEVEDSEEQQAVQALVDRLLEGVPEDLSGAPDTERGRWLLAQLLQWHRREEKSVWWRYFFLMNELTDEERREESDALGELTYEICWPDPAPRARSTIYRFNFPPQEHRIGKDSTPHDPATGRSAGTVVAIDDEAGAIDLKVGSTRPAPTPSSLVPLDRVPSKPKPESLQRLARWVLENGIDADGPFRSARDLLMRRVPGAGQVRGARLAEDSDPADAARRLVHRLNQSYLAIQGPPGSGKSSVGAEMIVALVNAGKKVGVTANSHKVIGELLAKVADTAGTRASSVRIGQRAPGELSHHAITPLADNPSARDALADGVLNVVGATAWLWASDDMVESVDVLFVDEAGQMSLADTLAASSCATNMVLLGDPQQLDQPLQGVHPPGAERSGLAHVLDVHHVVPDHLGIFLDGTWRLHPRIAAYTSEVFYEGRFHSHPGRESIQLQGAEPLTGTGIAFVPVAHTGNTNQSIEEADVIATFVRQLLDADPVWTDADGTTRALTEDDILVITPYNAQVAALSSRLPGIRVGTVDKFQGQQAPIAIYSMATSSPEEAPRGLEFLYSLNRLNVATSRAQCLAVVVANPQLLDAKCRTPRQMQLVNAFARLLELTTDGHAI